MCRAEPGLDARALAEHACDRASVAEEAERGLLVEQVQNASLVRVRVRKVEDVDEHAVLTNRLRSAAPLDELELGDLAVGLEVVVAAGVAGAE